MNKSELFEMASLDALGMLDEEERREFEEAFRSASPAIQEEIRREQRRLTDLDDVLPRVQPPAGLRDRVLMAVREAMGAMAPRRAGDVIARIGAGDWVVRRSVTPLWRAACIGFATATVVLIAVGFHLRTQYDEALQAFRDKEITEVIAQELGSEFVDRFFSPFSHKVSFQPASGSQRAQAAILIDPESRTAFLVTRNLPAAEGDYRLVIVNDAGDAQRTLASFTGGGQLSGTPINVSVEVGAPLAIVPPPASPGNTSAPVLYSL